MNSSENLASLLFALSRPRGLHTFVEKMLIDPLGKFGIDSVHLASLDEGPRLRLRSQSSLGGPVFKVDDFPVKAGNPLADCLLSPSGKLRGRAMDYEELFGKASERTIIASTLSNGLDVVGVLMFTGSPREETDTADAMPANLTELLELYSAFALSMEIRQAVRPRYLGDPQDRLTGRQIEILRQMSEQRTNHQIGRAMNLSVSSIKHESMRIFRFLQARTRGEAVSRAKDAGLMNQSESMSQSDSV